VSSRTLLAATAALLVYFLFFFGLDNTGLLGPDEPRHASIGREMAASGDWSPSTVGSRGSKPVLLLMTAMAVTAGPADLARPVALLSVVSGVLSTVPRTPMGPPCMVCHRGITSAAGLSVIWV
jgi:4-amino-4-deoxy-L-arabinose transferase-like glycosyltransferase